MPLRYPADWKFDGFPHAIPTEADNAFFELVKTIAEGTERPQAIFEAFKSAYGVDAWSSSPGWAETDLASAMSSAKSNAARYVAAFYAGLETVREQGFSVPKVDQLNKILATWNVPLVIDLPNLSLRSGDIQFAAVAASDEPTTPSFRLGPVIGRGGFGVVYRVTRETQVGKFDYALKVLEPSVFMPDKDRAEARFQREMLALSKLQHRGIVQLLEAGMTHDRKPYILMPYIDGAQLQMALTAATPATVLRAFEEILHALEFAHDQGVVHRDLKPQNVLVRSSDGQPIILDFGCAYLIDEMDEQQLTTTLIGTSAYVPSEVHRDPKHRSPKQDIYSCGVLLYQIISSKLPDPDEYEPIATKYNGYNGIDQVIQTALAPERQRTATAKEMRNRLSSLLV